MTLYDYFNSRASLVLTTNVYVDDKFIGSWFAFENGTIPSHFRGLEIDNVFLRDGALRISCHPIPVA